MRKFPKVNNVETLIDQVCLKIGQISGNVFGERQKNMVNSRVKKRMLTLSFSDPCLYADYISDNYDREMQELIGLLTTHHTFFFREYLHFEFLEKNFSKIVEKAREQGRNIINIWCAACSRGQEAYSLAMFLDALVKESYPGIDFRILATDIDQNSVEFAQKGIYRYQEIKEIPATYLKGNWARGTGDIADYARVSSKLKEKIDFRTLNLIEDKWDLSNKNFDIIFCRNVFIYFERPTIERIVSEFKKYSSKDGLLVLGVSESLVKKENLFSVGPAVYCWSDMFSSKSEKALHSRLSSDSVVSKEEEASPKIRVLSVDDSPVILKILTKIFEQDDKIELVGTCSDASQIRSFLDKNQVDLITLDLHMPELNGVDFLKDHYKEADPPVVVLSSASREDTQFSQEALKYGAVDFVEKPSMANLDSTRDEILSKIKLGVKGKRGSLHKIDSQLIAEKVVKTGNAYEDCLRVFIYSKQDFENFKSVAKALKKTDVPSLFLHLDATTERFEPDQLTKKISFDNCTNGEFIVAGKESLSRFKKVLEQKKVSWLFFSALDSLQEKRFLDCITEEHQVLLNEKVEFSENITKIANDSFPPTSFVYVSSRYFLKSKTDAKYKGVV